MQRRELLKYSMTLLGATAGTSVSSALLAGQNLHAASEVTVFTEQQKVAVNLLAEMIIPETDTPGAIEAGVPDFIASIVGEWYKDNERKIFFDGLEALDSYCNGAAGKPFTQVSEETRIAALQAQEKAAADYQGPPQARLTMPREDENAPFFKRLKELVVLGYYTSEVGATQELAYLPMPGYYNGSYDFSEIGREFTH